MSAQSNGYHRAKSILVLLQKHGPLSFSAINKMIQPPMNKKGVRKTLGILKKKKVIATRVIAENKTFYHIAQAGGKRKLAAEILGCQAHELVQPIYGNREWLHTELCEYWISLLQREFPHSLIIRESEFYNSEAAQRVMLMSKIEYELRPDFLLIFPKVDDLERVSIAVEIERSRKSNRRLVAKLKKYANKTFVDGVIYVCDSDGLSDTIRQLYRSKVVDNSHRIKHYGDNFYLFSDAINTHSDPLSQFYNSGEADVSLTRWVNYLRSTKRNFRRDSDFANVGTTTPDSKN